MTYLGWIRFADNLQPMDTYYTFAGVLFLAIVLGLVVCILGALSQAAARAGHTGNSLPLWVGTGILIWLALLALLAYTGFFENFRILPPRMAFAVLPPLLVILFLAGSGRLSRLLAVLPPAWLVGAQVFRVVVEIVLWLMLLDKRLPVQMTFEGLNYDILTGLTAPLVARYLAGDPFKRKAVGVVWNFIGLGLLLNIVTIALLSTPSPFRFFMNEPANTLVAQWPYIWLPGFVVPVAFMLHIFSLKQLLALSEPDQEEPAKKSFLI